MRDYLFVLGRDPELSVLEIVSYLIRKSVTYKLREFNDSVVLISLPSLDFHSVISDLGGTVKIAELLPSLSALVFEKNKVLYGVSQIKGDSSSLVKELGLLFKLERIKATRRYGSVREIPPSQSLHLDLELVVYRKDAFKVIAVSNPKLYRERDTKRPFYNPLKGTSIRLAKILINLGRAKDKIVDPFCGMGTILQEALLMGYNVVGIDRNISEAEKNIAWLGEKYKGKSQLIQGRAEHISSYLRDAESVVTEPYLGPYLKKLPKKEDAVRVARSLEQMYLMFLRDLRAIVRGKVVIIIPRFRTDRGLVRMDFDSILKNAGFKVSSPLKSINVPVLYRYPDSKLDRLIYVLEKN